MAGITTFKPSKTYKYHSGNYEKLKEGFDALKRCGRREVATENEPGQTAIRNSLLILLGALAEVRLFKILNEPGGFQEIEKEEILNSSSTLEDRWKKIIHSAAARHCGKPYNQIETANRTLFLQCEELLTIITNDLSGVIKMRNKMAHGQWLYPFVSHGEKVESELVNKLRKENLLKISIKFNLLDSLGDAVTDLTVSRPTFSRDFDSHMARISNLQAQLTNKSHDKWVADCRKRHAAQLDAFCRKKQTDDPIRGFKLPE